MDMIPGSAFHLGKLSFPRTVVVASSIAICNRQRKMKNVILFYQSVKLECTSIFLLTYSFATKRSKVVDWLYLGKEKRFPANKVNRANR